MQTVHCQLKNTIVGIKKEFKIEVGLYQGSALNPFLFIVIMDAITEEIDKGKK